MKEFKAAGPFLSNFEFKKTVYFVRSLDTELLIYTKKMLDRACILYYIFTMKLPGIEWDETKNEINKREHEGLSFEEAQYVFLDSERIERLDRSEHNTSGEDRYQTLGKVGKVLFAVYAERGENKRIISARLADKAERRSYSGYYHIDGRGWTKAS
jgi:uncharacterized DUF497 family protein